MHENLEINIRKIFPNLGWKKSKFIAAGWDHDILMLDKKFVARIPKNSDAKKRMQIDFCLLTYLQNKVDADIPTAITKDDKTKIAIYKVVAGTAVAEGRYKKLNTSEKDKFAKNLAIFLSQIHNLPVADARKCRVPIRSLTSQNREVKNNIRFIYSHLTQQEKKVLDNFIISRKFLLKEIKPVLIHGDLTSDNVFADKHYKNNLGIIDFSDSVIGDPAKDFAALFSYGEKFVNNVIKYYQTTPDSGLFERARVYYQDEAIKLLVLAIKGSKFINKKDAKKLFQERFKIKRV